MKMANLKKKIRIGKTSGSMLLTFAIIVIGGLILKVIADSESNARIDY
jgi:hypothetical protein